MIRAIFFTTLLVVCAALPALSAELEFSGAGDVEYDDNIYRASENKQDDILIRLRPGVRIYEDRGDDLSYSVGYQAPIEFAIDAGSDYDEVDHIGDGRFTYHVNDQLELFANEHYGYLRSTVRSAGVDPVTTDEGSLQFNDERDRIKVNDASLGALYKFSPRTTGRLIASSSFFDSSRSDRARVWSVAGNADAHYRLTLKHQLGAGAGYSYQDFSDRVDIEGSQTNTYRVFGTWRWTITETLAFDLDAGPAYLETDQDDAPFVRFAPRTPFVELGEGLLAISTVETCGAVDGRAVSSLCAFNIVVNNPAGIDFDLIQITNTNPTGESDSEVTGFVDAVLAQQWSPTLSTALRYSRHQGDASGLGGTVIVDAVSLSNAWDFAERWRLDLRGDWTRRENAFEIAQTYDEVVAGPAAPDPPGGSIAERSGVAFNSRRKVEIDTDRWGVAAQVTHRLFKNTSIYGRVRYDEQDSRKDTLGNASDFENFLATFGVHHVFEPIPLW
jgi:predicted porin